MKKSRIFSALVIIVFLLTASLISADTIRPKLDSKGNLVPPAYAGGAILKKAPSYDYVLADEFTGTTEYESLVTKVQGLLNDLSLELAKLRTYSKNTFMVGNTDTLGRLLDVTNSVLNNLAGVIENYTPKASKDVVSALNSVRAKLKKAYGYNFGPDRPVSFVIPLITNETKGEIDVVIGFENGTDEYGNIVKVPLKHTVRYTVAPGLYATKQDEREIIVVDALPDSEFKVAVGIFYVGQETATVIWDERTYSQVDSFLDYHNVCGAQKAWIKCGVSSCIPYSQNKTVNVYNGQRKVVNMSDSQKKAVNIPKIIENKKK